MERERMRPTRMLTTLTAAAAIAAISAPAGAQQISEARIRELIKQAADRSATETTIQPPASATGAARPTVAMTLDEAVKFALERNLDISVQRLNPEINDIAVASITSVYHPSLTSVVSQSA